MQNEIGMTNLGATDPIELWVSTPDPIKYLAQIKIAPFASLGSQSRLALEKEFSADPNSSGLTAAYRLSLLFALILALFITWTAHAMLRRDSARVLYYVESMGSNPKYIRKSLQIAVGISIAIGLAIGSLLGTLVSRPYISHSIPYVNFTTLIALTAAFGFIGVIALSSKFFTEKSMVSQ